MATNVNCPHCGQLLAIPDSAGTNLFACPSCSGQVEVADGVAGLPSVIPLKERQATPQPAPDEPDRGTDAAVGDPPRRAVAYCPRCGEANDGDAVQCRHCRQYLSEPVRSGGGQNMPALLALIFGALSVPSFACCGLFAMAFGLPALILGIVGLRRAQAEGNSSAVAMSWAGIAIGGMACLGGLLGVVVLMVQALSQ